MKTLLLILFFDLVCLATSGFLILLLPFRHKGCGGMMRFKKESHEEDGFECNTYECEKCHKKIIIHE